MSATVEQLIENLEDSQKIYQELLPVFRKEKEAAFFSEPDKFSAIIAEKEELLAHLRQLERRRQLMLSQISTVLKIPADKLRLSTLADTLEAPQSTRIRRLRLSFNGLLGKVQQANAQNRLLIQHCLGIVQNNLVFFQHWTMPKDVYGASGQINMYQKNGNIVSGAV